jgi:N-acetyl-beta-hexosaminidase
MMKYSFHTERLLLFLVFLSFGSVKAQQKADSIMPVRGLCIGAPSPKQVDSFVLFIDQGMAAKKINLLVLQVEYNYKFKSHPELADSSALSEADVKKIVAACRRNRIRLIPQINMLGHQSWANKPNMLLTRYPQFDETPWIKMPAVYKWPNADSLYCKSYCPLLPAVHQVVFDVMDELVDVFESDAFHAGMDEVFIIGDDRCPRCAHHDKSKLFADEVTAFRDHLAKRNKELWIWGDRLIDGRTTGIGEWEASYNDTWRAVDMIPKDVVINDWHYERADKTAVYFAMKGLRVITCPWREPGFAVQQVRDIQAFREQSTPEMKDRFLGVMETTWSSTAQFIRGYYGETPVKPVSPVATYKALCDVFEKWD